MFVVESDTERGEELTGGTFGGRHVDGVDRFMDNA